MFTPKEIVDFLKESMQDNNWYVDTKKIGTPPNHRFFSPTLVRNHVVEAHKQLSAKQKKIAAMAGDKDKIDADDLAKLRSMKEETVDEVAPPGWEGTVKKMKGKKDIDNPWALAWSMKKKGYKSHVKEDAELDEASDIDKLGKKYAKAEKDEAEKQDTYSKKYPGGNKQKEADKAAFMKRFANEEVEQIDEISTNTASSYADKAWASGDDKRAKGLNLAIKKMSGKAKVSTNEEADQIEENQMRPEITQIIEDATVRAWTQVHTKGSKAQREKLDKVHAKNPKYQAFKKGLDGHSAPAEKPKAAAPKEEPKSSEESPWQKLRRINAERTKRAMELGKAHRSGGVGSSGTSANQSPLEKKLGGHDVSHLEKKKAPASLGASPSEREAEKADKKEAPKANAVERKPARLTGKKLGI